MDNVCHTLAGAALGRAGLASRTRYGMATLMIGANLPDVDVAVFFTDTLPMSFRRGWTHGVLAQAVLPVAFAGIVWAIGRRASRHAAAGVAAGAAADGPSRQQPDTRCASFGWVLVLSYVAVISHVFMDFLNSYGVRLLMPFSGRWFFGDALYIIDPWLYLVFGVGVWTAGRAARAGRWPATRPARLALAVAGAYMLAMLASNVWARSVVREGLTRAGLPATTRFMVTPVLVNPFRREVLIDTGERYEKGIVWFEPAPHFRPAGYGVDVGLDQPEAAAALATPRAQAFLRWSRFPYVVIDRTTAPPVVLLNDYRYSDAGARAGWAGLSLKIAD
jgi:inner membrane protein